MRPPMAICYICGREFGTKSIGIHEPQCLQKWQMQNDALPPGQRQPAPVKPQPIGSGTGRSVSGGGGGGGGGRGGGGPTQDMNDAARAAYEANLRPCGVCGRTFAMDRIQVHEKICKSTGKKRPTFNAFKQRTKDFAGLAVSAKKSRSSSRKSLPNHWREKHSEFINAIRYAKQVDSVQKSGGKVKNLPPPPRSTNPDYVQCPHCSRRFAPDVAQRHIPSCANTVNKPKPPPRPPAPSRGGGGGGGYEEDGWGMPDRGQPSRGQPRPRGPPTGGYGGGYGQSANNR